MELWLSNHFCDHLGREATAINDNGQIVGWSRLTSSGAQAALWEDGSLFNLNDLLDPGDPLTVDTLLLQAFDINESGQIVGQALFAKGNNGRSAYHGFLLTPVVVPVPAAIWLFGSGLIGLISMATRKHT